MRRLNNGRNNMELSPWRGGLWPSDFFNDFLGDSFFSGFGSGMKADVRETDDSYIIDVEVPGMNRDNIDIDLDDNVLTVTAKIADSKEIEEQDGRYIRRERRSGAFRRSFLMDNIKTEKIDARMENGVLTVICPKTESKAPTSRKIDIK